MDRNDHTVLLTAVAVGWAIHSAATFRARFAFSKCKMLL